jgi:deazaflavin-dependent oxidoreductase (nitroreductase family)
MLRRAGSVGGVLLVAAAALAVVFVVGIRTKYPPVVDRVRRLARDVGNPRVITSAGKPGARASIIRHTGRASGKQYETPVTAVVTTEGFVIALPYGPTTDWVKNVLARGSATLVHEGTSHRVDRPQVVPSALAARDFSAREQRTLRWFGVDECLRLHRAG